MKIVLSWGLHCNSLRNIMLLSLHYLPGQIQVLASNWDTKERSVLQQVQHH